MRSHFNHSDNSDYISGTHWTSCQNIGSQNFERFNVEQSLYRLNGISDLVRPFCYGIIHKWIPYKLLFKSLSILFLTVICAVQAIGQSTIQDLVEHLDQLNSEKEKYQEILRYETDRKEAINNDYAKIMENTIDYFIEKGKPKVALPLVNTLASYYIFGNHVDYERASYVLNKAKPYLRVYPVDSVLMNFYVLSGELNIYGNDPDDAIQDFKTIITNSRQAGDTLHTNFGYAHLKLAEIFSSEWNILESDKYFHQAADFFIQKRDTTMYLWALSGRSTLYSNNGLYHEAEDARDEILRTGLASDRLQIVATAHLSAALEYKDRKMDSLQHIHLVQAMRYINFPSDVRDYLKTITFALFTQFFSDHKMVDSTDHYIDKFRNFYKPEKHGPWIGEYYRLAQACRAFVHQKYSKAERITWELVDEAQSKNKLTNLTRLYDMVVDIYNESGNKSKAFKTLVIYNRLQDSLETIQFNNQFLYYNQLFEAEKKDKQIVQQDASIQLLSEQNKVLFWRGLLVILFISGLFLIIYLLRSYHYSRQKSALQQGFSQNLIQQQERERARISQELHDGISQELILIKNKLDQDQNTETATMVAGSLSQLRQVSRSLYPVLLKSFGLKAALEQLLKKIDDATSDMEVSYHISDCGGYFSKEEKLHLYRIIQEAINNVLKYADCSHLEIIMKDNQDDIILVVQDNGNGMDLNSRTFFQKGIGMNSMEERTKILGGSFELRSAEGKGTRIKVKIPKK